MPYSRATVIRTIQSARSDQVFPYVVEDLPEQGEKANDQKLRVLPRSGQGTQAGNYRLQNPGPEHALPVPDLTHQVGGGCFRGLVTLIELSLGIRCGPVAEICLQDLEDRRRIIPLPGHPDVDLPDSPVLSLGVP